MNYENFETQLAPEIFYCIQKPCIASWEKFCLCYTVGEMRKGQSAFRVRIRPSILNFKNSKSKRTHLFVSAFISLLLN